MMLVVTYDVDTSDSAGQKRLRKVAKICERHGMRVQNSVFEVLVDAAQLVVLKQELGKAIDMEQDSVRFYRLGNSYENRIESMGRKPLVEAGSAMQDIQLLDLFLENQRKPDIKLYHLSAICRKTS